MINIRRHRLYNARYLCLAKCIIIGILMIIWTLYPSNTLKEVQFIQIGNEQARIQIPLQILKLLENKSDYTYEKLTQWNRSLCNIQSHSRGPHQKIISISIYGITSKFTDNPMYSWNTTIIPFLEQLSNEVKLLLPSWIIRVYTDFIGSTKSQQNLVYRFSNVDVCDMHSLPLFNASLLAYLPGRIWRFLPVFDPYVDYVLCRDLDSPIAQREIETIDMWMSDEQKKNFFYIARDHKQHETSILSGLWGAATIRARQYLFEIFQNILVPSIGHLYTGAGDQQFLTDFIWDKVKKHSLTFDSYYCQRYGGRPFLSQRPRNICFLGCIRPCCTNTTNDNFSNYIKPCPIACRPKNHQDWTYC